MPAPTSTLRCSGCGAEVDPDEPLPFRCPRAASPGDHVLARHLDPAGLELPVWPVPDHPEEQPFVRYRALLHPYGFARRRGLTDADYVALVRDLDAAVAAVDGRGFRRTPLVHATAIETSLGLDRASVYVKDETGNVAGSHKGRHLFGLVVQLAVAHRAGRMPAWPPRLAIASCGNAALAAAVLARAVGWPLAVYVPPGADPLVLARLADLGADIVPCPRELTGPAGDPCVHRFREAVAAGALPFSCQGPDNGLTVDGGRTLAYELVEALTSADASTSGDTPTHEDRPTSGHTYIYVQVGGGALASGLAAGLEDLREIGALGKPVGLDGGSAVPKLRPPRLVAVQTEGAAPLARAYERVAAAAGTGSAELPPPAPGPARLAAIEAALAEAARRRDDYMWPWESEPASAAAGILDDETYDWWAVVSALLRRGGYPVVASERLVVAARDLGRAVGFAADATGTAGLAGLLTDLEARRPPAGSRIVLLFTGAERASGPG